MSPTQRPLLENTQHSQETDIQVPGGIQSRNPSKRRAEDPCFIPRGHWDRCIQSRNPSKRRAEDPCFIPRGQWDRFNTPLVKHNANEVRELIKRIDLFMNDSVTWKCRLMVTCILLICIIGYTAKPTSTVI